MSLIPNAVSRQVFRSALLLKKNSPNIMFVVGIGGVVTSTVLACRATLKLSEILPEMKSELEEVKTTNTAISSDENKRDIAFVYGKNTIRVAQLYAPAVVVGSFSIAALTGSHVTLNRRNAGLTAAYAAVSKAYDEYRNRVKIEVGEDREKDIYHATYMEKVEQLDGKMKEVKRADPNNWSPYARFFDEGSINWQKNSELNRLFVQCQQTYANNLLHSRGHVFLNEVYDMLGIDRSQAGQVVGWVLNHDGDNYIDFGMFEANSSRFINGWEASVLLDFNVDGVIYDKL